MNLGRNVRNQPHPKRRFRHGAICQTIKALPVLSALHGSEMVLLGVVIRKCETPATKGPLDILGGRKNFPYKNFSFKLEASSEFVIHSISCARIFFERFYRKTEKN